MGRVGDHHRVSAMISASLSQRDPIEDTFVLGWAVFGTATVSTRRLPLRCPERDPIEDSFVPRWAVAGTPACDRESSALIAAAECVDAVSGAEPLHCRWRSLLTSRALKRRY